MYPTSLLQTLDSIRESQENTKQLLEQALALKNKRDAQIAALIDLSLEPFQPKRPTVGEPTFSIGPLFDAGVDAAYKTMANRIRKILELPELE